MQTRAPAGAITPGERNGDLMRFYALQMVCDTCSNSFLVGGSVQNDLTMWHDLLVECRNCGREFPAALGTPVDLTPPEWLAA